MPVVSQVVNLFDDNYKLHTLMPGDEIPEWALEKITNPEVLATEPPRVEPSDETPEKEVGQEEVPQIDYSTLKKPELEALCDERGLDKTGNKPDLIARLVEHDAKPVEVDLWSMNEAELRALAAERGVDVGEANTTAELAAVLSPSEG